MKKILVSGIQPTGSMHLGNFLGAIQNWVKLQEEFDPYFMIVDYHALTSTYENPSELRLSKKNLALDLLSAGVDPEKACLFYQSDVPEHGELHLLLSMITPLAWLERVPSYKDKMVEMKDKQLNTYGFLGYPLLQAADIMLYQGDVVPVGKDQLPHLELTREVIRRFNHFYKTKFAEPDSKLADIQLLPGLDGQKMSKSYNNTIPLNMSEEDLQKLIMKMQTDPGRVKRTDPGNPDICPVFAYHKIFNQDKVADIDKACRTAEIGCVDCKKDCAQSLNNYLAEFRHNRQEWLKREDDIQDILKANAQKARKKAQETLVIVRESMGL